MAQASVLRELTRTLLRLSPCGVLVAHDDVLRDARQVHLPFEGQLDGVHQHQPGIGRELAHELDRGAAPVREVHGNQDPRYGSWGNCRTISSGRDERLAMRSAVGPSVHVKRLYRPLGDSSRWCGA